MPDPNAKGLALEWNIGFTILNLNVHMGSCLGGGGIPK